MESGEKSSVGKRRMLLIIATACIVVSVCAAIIGLTIGLKSKPKGPETVPESPSFPGFKSEYRRYRYAAVTTDAYNNCSKIGTDILGSQRGSVVDAAIATYLCNCVINAHSCGIGGGHIAVIYARNVRTGNLELMSLMARERAPASATAGMFVNNSLAAQLGGLASGIPGEIHGFYEAHQRYGRMNWSDLFTETIRLCREGYIIERALAGAMRSNEQYIRNQSYNLGEIYLTKDGRLKQEGDKVIDEKLADTLIKIAQDPFSFYMGPLAQDIVQDLQDHGGIITLEDLANYNSTVKDPVEVSLNNGQFTLYNPPPPSSGVVLDFILGILDGYNFKPEHISETQQEILTYHRIAEAFKFAYAKRSELGDEDFVNVTELVSNLTSPDYWTEIRKQITDSHTHNDVRYYGPTFDILEDKGTSHINILAPDGTAVSLTGTINLYFGSKVRGKKTGIIFNNEMDDFSTPGLVNYFGVPSSPSNYIEPDKMPMSSMCPTLVRDRTGKVVMLSGAAGGTRITTATALILMNRLWFGLDLGNSTDKPRIHHQLLANELVYENAMDKKLVEGLRGKQHVMTNTTSSAVVTSIFNSCMTSSINDNFGFSQQYCIEAASDGRKGGAPDGY